MSERARLPPPGGSTSGLSTISERGGGDVEGVKALGGRGALRYGLGYSGVGEN